jgi:hypothetical protein
MLTFRLSNLYLANEQTQAKIILYLPNELPFYPGIGSGKKSKINAYSIISDCLE